MSTLTTTRITRKQLAFAMRALANAKIVKDLWSGMSWYDGRSYLITTPDTDAFAMNPLDTLSVSAKSLREEDEESEMMPEKARSHPTLKLHAALHRVSGKPCVLHLTNLNTYVR